MSSHKRLRQVLALKLLAYNLSAIGPSAPSELPWIVQELMPKQDKFPEEDVEKYIGGTVEYAFRGCSFEDVTKKALWNSANFTDFVWRLLVAVNVREGLEVNYALLPRVQKVLDNIGVEEEEALQFSRAFLHACLDHALS